MFRRFSLTWRFQTMSRLIAPVALVLPVKSTIGMMSWLPETGGGFARRRENSAAGDSMDMRQYLQVMRPVAHSKPAVCEPALSRLWPQRCSQLWFAEVTFKAQHKAN